MLEAKEIVSVIKAAKENGVTSLSLKDGELLINFNTDVYVPVTSTVKTKLTSVKSMPNFEDSPMDYLDDEMLHLSDPVEFEKNVMSGGN